MIKVVCLILIVVVHGNLLKSIDTARPTEKFDGEQSGKIKSSKEQYRFLPPVNIDPTLPEARPIPTNVWWGNLIAKDEFQRSQPIYSHPYKIEMELDQAPYGIQICYSYQYRANGPLNDNGAINFYIHGMGVQDMILTANEFTSMPTVHVRDWDDFGVTADMFMDDGGKMTTVFAMGMAFIGATYENLVPVLSTTHVITSINGQAINTISASIIGKKFVLQLNNQQTWVVYASDTIAWSMVDKKLVATEAFTGVLRTALLSGDDLNQYDAYASCIVQGGELQVPNENQYNILWKTSGDCSNGLLHLALEHQIDILDENFATPVAGMELQTTTKGTIRGYATKTTPPQWKFSESGDVSIGFYPPRKPSPSTLEKYDVLNILKDDIEATWNLPRKGSFYFTGKLAQKYANLCLMAADVNLVGQDKTLLSTCISKLQQQFGHFLDNSWTYPLVYDEVYRGICSSEAFIENNQWSDFGNTMYNDHHFHYGYWIVSSAILKHLDPTWSRINELDRMIALLLRDVANPSDDDIFFPKFRQFDWFAGHSYSHGISPFGDGKDQESASEEINFHYGMMLWGVASKNADLVRLGKLMMKINTRSIDTYFFMKADNKVHPPAFIKNKVTGIYFDNKVDYATWFCGRRECIHGIQMIPVSPINEHFRSKQFVTEEWNDVLSNIDIIQNREAVSAWKSLIYANYATIDKFRALDELAVSALDDGLSRSWALYYAATRPGSDIEIDSQGPVASPPSNKPSDPIPTPSPTVQIDITVAPTDSPISPTPVDSPSMDIVTPSPTTMAPATAPPQVTPAPVVEIPQTPNPTNAPTQAPDNLPIQPTTATPTAKPDGPKSRPDVTKPPNVYTPPPSPPAYGSPKDAVVDSINVAQTPIPTAFATSAPPVTSYQTLAPPGGTSYTDVAMLSQDEQLKLFAIQSIRKAQSGRRLQSQNTTSSSNSFRLLPNWQLSIFLAIVGAMLAQYTIM